MFFLWTSPFSPFNRWLLYRLPFYKSQPLFVYCEWLHAFKHFCLINRITPAFVGAHACQHNIFSRNFQYSKWEKASNSLLVLKYQLRLSPIVDIFFVVHAYMCTQLRHSTLRNGSLKYVQTHTLKLLFVLELRTWATDYCVLRKSSSHDAKCLPSEHG